MTQDDKKTSGSRSIDNRGESERRYGSLEPEGYSRHSHGNREGEAQAGGKSEPEVPVEQTAPLGKQRYRKDDDAASGSDEVQYGGLTRDGHPGDKDSEVVRAVKQSSKAA